MSCFNPHPVARPGATGANAAGKGLVVLVSILTRSQGRVRQVCIHSRFPDGLVFQSSPGRKAGCDERGVNHLALPVAVSILTRSQGRVRQDRPPRRRRRRAVFQSSPGRKAGCDPHRAARRHAAAHRCAVFQSSPGRKAGCDTRTYRLIPTPPNTFQSSPGRKAGCDSYAVSLDPRRGCCFNPHPVARPGATPVLAIGKRANGDVSILTRSQGRVRRLL